jgi:hypothetical protein
MVSLGAMLIVRVLIHDIFAMKGKVNLNRLFQNMENAWILSNSHSDNAMHILMEVVQIVDVRESAPQIIGMLGKMFDDEPATHAVKCVCAICCRLVEHGLPLYEELVRMAVVDQLMDLLERKLQNRCSSPGPLLEFVSLCLDKLPVEEALDLGQRIPYEGYRYAISEMSFSEAALALDIVTKLLMREDRECFVYFRTEFDRIHKCLCDDSPFVVLNSWVRFAFAMMRSGDRMILDTLVMGSFVETLAACLDSECPEATAYCVMTLKYMIDADVTGECEWLLETTDETMQGLERVAAMGPDFVFDFGDGEMVCIPEVAGMICSLRR